MQTSEYACPRKACQAQPGEPCVDRNGTPRFKVHAGREKLDPVVSLRMAEARRKNRTYWLTVGKGGECGECARGLLGVPAVYRHSPKSVLCRGCADHLRIRYSISGTWMRLKAAERKAA